MERGMRKVVLVTRKTRLEELVLRYNTMEQARFYVEHMGADFTDYLLEDRVYQQAVSLVTETVLPLARFQRIDREYLPGMIFGKEDIVIALGQDGLVANTMKYLEGQPLLGVNPDTKRWDGVLLPFEPGQLKTALPRIFAGQFQGKEISMAEAVTRDGQRMLAVNDLFIGCRSHVSARYELEYQGRKENQSSSGIIVSTGLGATGWYKSIMTEAAGISRLMGGGAFTWQPLPWNAKSLTFVVREPYPSRSTGAGIVCGKIGVKEPFRVTSQMAEGGVVFSDGMEKDAIEFTAGSEVKIQVAKKTGFLVE